MNTDSWEAPVKSTEKPQLLSPIEAAKFLGRTVGTLSIWRCTQRYDLPFVKVGRSVMYDVCDLIRFIERRKVRRREVS